MNIFSKQISINALIIIAGSLLFIPFLGAVHLFDWDEINFAESAREMILTGNYLDVQINFEIFWEKPPLFIWLQVLSMKLFGINEFAARFPNAICGIATLLIMYNIGKKLFNNQFGIIWIVTYIGSILPHFYFRSGIIDPWFNLFIFLGIYFYINYLSKDENSKRNIILSAFCIGLGVLTKGPVALLMFLLTGFVLLIIRKFKIKFKIFDYLIWVAVFLFVGGFWFILQIIDGNYNIMVDFIEYQIRLFKTEDAGHGGFFGYHFVVLLFGVFPASVFALKSLFSKTNSNENSLFRLTMIILLCVILVVFSITKTKIVHYSSLAYFPLTFLATHAIHNIVNQKLKKNKWIDIAILIFAILVALILSAVIWVGNNSSKIIEMNIIKDKFAVGNLHANAGWTGFEIIPIIVLVGGILFSLIKLKQTSILAKYLGIFVATTLFTSLTIILLVPRIEKYSQNAAIEFYKSISKEDCYVETLGFKSYADIFYFEKKIPTNKTSSDDQWLLTGEIDKPAYFVVKNTRENKYSSSYPELIKIGEKNGFVFFKRNVKSIKNDK